MEHTGQLAALRDGPYAGVGGVFALASALGVHTNTLKAWQNGSRVPTYRHRQRIDKLWRSHA